MHPRWIWIAAALLYGAFSLWYDSWRAPLAPEEVESYVAHFAERLQPRPDDERLAALRAFLESDDGGEFFMVNLLRLAPQEVTPPGGGEARPARELLEHYSSYFMAKLFRRAGHPAFFARAAGGYIESWGVSSDPGWSAAGVIRYRSRRDMAELATDPEFEPAHGYKIAALASTFAFPATPGGVLAGPRMLMVLVLALAAALAQLVLTGRRTSPDA